MSTRCAAIRVEPLVLSFNEVTIGAVHYRSTTNGLDGSRLPKFIIEEGGRDVTAE